MKNKTSKSTTRKTQTLPLGFQPIQDSCEILAGERRLISGVLEKLNADLAMVRAAAMPILRMRANSRAMAHINLVNLIDRNRPLFKSPKTRIFSDIKVGLRKLEGETVIADPDKTVELIAKHFPDRLDELAPATRAPRKDALKNLTGAELKKIGVEITGDTEAVIVKPQSSDVEKAVAALLKETETELKQAA